MKIKVFSMSNCPYCVKAKDHLIREGFAFEIVVLDNDQERQAFYDQQGLVGKERTMPQVFANDDRVGGYENMVLDSRFWDEAQIPVLMTPRELRFLLFKLNAPVVDGEFSGIRPTPTGFTAHQTAGFVERLRNALPVRPHDTDSTPTNNPQ